MKYKTISLALISTFFLAASAIAQNKQKLKINGAVVEVRDGAVAKLQIKKQKVPFLGVYAVPINPALSRQLNLPNGLYLSMEQAIPDSPAAKAGLERFDVLMKFDDQILVNSQQLQALVRSKKKGDLVKLSILRGGEKKTIEVQLDEQQVPNVDFGRALPAPHPDDPRLGFGGQGFPFAPNALPLEIDGLHGNLDLQLLFGDDVRAQLQRGDQLGQALNDPELLEKYDADGDGKLSKIEQDNARADGALPKGKFGGNRAQDLRQRMQEHMKALRERQLNRPLQPLGRAGAGADLQNPELLEKYDADRDGELSPIEQGNARADGALPERNLDFGLGLDFGGIPDVNELLRDARRRGAASTWSSVSGAAQTKVMTMDESGSYEFSSNDGDKRFKATNPAGEVLFDGPVNTKEERAKVPEDLRQRLDSIEGNVKIRVNPARPGFNAPQRPNRPQLKRKEKGKQGKIDKNQLL